MTLNCIQWCGSSSRVLGSMEYSFTRTQSGSIFSWLGFVKRRSRRDQSTPFAGTIVTDRVDTGLKCTVAAEDLVKAKWRPLLLVPFVHEGIPARVFYGGDNMVGGQTSVVTVFSLGGPFVNVTGTKEFFSSSL